MHLPINRHNDKLLHHSHRNMNPNRALAKTAECSAMHKDHKYLIRKPYQNQRQRKSDCRRERSFGVTNVFSRKRESKAEYKHNHGVGGYVA
ncbi:hypothetical protein TMatcc_004058 [Talaromyces marneffei ATCC 18224]